MTADEPRDPHRLSPGRARGVRDLTDRLPLGQAAPLVTVETLGLAILFAFYAVLDTRESELAPLLVPLAVSYVLIVANSAARSARPLRVVGSYAIAGCVGLGISALPGPTFPEAVLAGGATMLAMHVTGALHSPAIAVAMIAVLANFTPVSAAQALPLLVILAALVVGLAWLSHRVLGDADYPAGWW
ncbi:MAG: HPP family protein [bacterium]|nr:HPP family protein [bacterium]